VQRSDDPIAAAPAPYPPGNVPVTRGRSVLAVLLSLCLVGLFAASMPFARTPTAHTDLLLPAYAAAIFLLETITAALLFSLYSVQRSRALLFLASGYLFSALLTPAWVLSFPGVFSAFGIDLGLQSTAAIAATRRLGFPLFVLVYALAPRRGPARESARLGIGGALLATSAGAGLIVALILANRDGLPPFMLDAREVTMLWSFVPPLAIGLYCVSIALLLIRHRSPLDIWICLVLFSLIIELLLISYLGGATRLSVGWWAGRLYGLVAASIVLLVLLSESTLVYARLARTIAAERRTRQNRLTAMEALSASIAHEINQPLASMITNADAALRWLGKAEPRLDKAKDALGRIVADGHRASAIVTGIRTMFTTGSQERTELDLAALVTGAVRAAQTEAIHEFIDVDTDVDTSLPCVIGNAVQLHHVLRNLLENAIDAVRGAGRWPRRIVVRARRQTSGDVHVSVEDTGSGISDAVAERLFDPFISTKPGGMGMGLMFCRAVIEAHGGRIWTDANHPHGAIFHFSLPAAILPAGEERERAR
jgi:signal transduction histidine kinase